MTVPNINDQRVFLYVKTLIAHRSWMCPQFRNIALSGFSAPVMQFGSVGSSPFCPCSDTVHISAFFCSLGTMLVARLLSLLAVAC